VSGMYVKTKIISNRDACNIISQFMSSLVGHKASGTYGLHIRRTGHNPPHGPSANWRLTTANAAGTNGLTSLTKHGGARDNKFLVTHPTDQCCLTSASALSAGPSSSSRVICKYVITKILTELKQ
jgi:hypothetical protein